MPKSSFQGMQLLSDADLTLILRVTDGLQLHRDWIVLPIDAIPEGRETQQPDGKIIIHAPDRRTFDAWLAGLRGRLEELDLGAVPRATEEDPKRFLTGPFGIKAEGTRTYLGDRGILR